MSETDRDIEMIEVSNEEARRVIALAQALDRLHDNPDFKLVFLEEYLEREAIRLVHLKGEVGLTEDVMQRVDNRMIGISSMRGYMQSLNAIARQAQEALESNEAELENIRSGELQEAG